MGVRCSSDSGCFWQKMTSPRSDSGLHNADFSPELSKFDWLREFEADGRLGRKNDILIAGKSRASGAGASASKRADRGALTTARESTDDSAQSRASTGENCGAFALPFGRECLYRSL